MNLSNILFFFNMSDFDVNDLWHSYKMIKIEKSKAEKNIQFIVEWVIYWNPFMWNSSDCVRV